MSFHLDEFPVIHNAAQQRFEIHIEGHTAELTYTLGGDTIVFMHTGVPSALEGQGVGSKLVKASLDYARANHLKIRSLCWFVSGYIQRHPEYQT